MDIRSVNEEEVPLPPEDVRIKRIGVEPFADGRRLRVKLSLTPFQIKPNVGVEVLSRAGEVVTSVCVVETTHKDLELVLHLPASAGEGIYTVRAVLYHHELSSGDTMEMSIELGRGAGHA